jgi:hypothetical protein
MEIRPSLLPAYYTLVAGLVLIFITGVNSHPTGQKGDGDADAIIVALQPNTMNVPTALLIENTGVPGERQDFLSDNQRIKRGRSGLARKGIEFVRTKGAEFIDWLSRLETVEKTRTYVGRKWDEWTD